AGVEVVVAQFVVRVGRIRTKLRRALVRANRLIVPSLLHFAVPELIPGLGTFWIAIRRRPKVAERVVIVSQPHRINPAAIPQVREGFRLVGTALRRKLSESEQLSA